MRGDTGGAGGSRADSLLDRFAARTATVAVVGLGYVGLPMAVALAEAGYRVVGIDLDAAKVQALGAGRSYLNDVSAEAVARLVAAGRLSAGTDYAPVAGADVVIICVPTPFTASKAPDISFVTAASTSLAPHLRPDTLIILQSTTYPGTTEEEVLPILEGSGLRVGRDLWLAFSPERINPGDREYGVGNTPKVVGGVTPGCTERAVAFLTTLAAQVYPVSSPRAAEMAKLLENIFRSVNIALVNELALLSERMGIDIWEVIGAASTKPFGFMPFYPGAGVGGHCIPVDPYYLSWKAREYDFFTGFIELAAQVNQRMPEHVAEKVQQALNDAGRALRGARVLVLGVAFKRDIDDARNSPAERVVELLEAGGAAVRYHDPFVAAFQIGGRVPSGCGPPRRTLASVPLTDEELTAADAVVIVTGHSALDYERVGRLGRIVVDAPNVLAGSGVTPRARVYRVGAPARE